MRNWLSPYARVLLLITLLFTGEASAQQVDLAGPSGSGQFGYTVTVLPNGNIVVTDPGWDANTGAVYLLAPDGTQINVAMGQTPGDQVGSGGIVVLKTGNYVIRSPHWHNINTGVADAGAVTFGSHSGGVFGGSSVFVSESNSIVGTDANEMAGDVVVALANGHYVVATPLWNGERGAVTWGDGLGGTTTGAVSAANSLVGSTPGDAVGNSAGGSPIVPLPNGNYVVVSTYWTDSISSVPYVGAVTWVSGTNGLVDTVSRSNSLYGTTDSDEVGSGGIVPLGASGNYVVNSNQWNNGAAGSKVGAVTWSGNSGIVGAVNILNSLYGTHANDQVGLGGINAQGVVALSNGNYVVGSYYWNPNANGTSGALTWGSGSTGVHGAIDNANSVIGGSNVDDEVGYGITALSNGNYVVCSPYWNNNAGAATWFDGTAATSGSLSAANSLVGSNAGDYVCQGAVALSNGNYVVTSPAWNTSTGAATFGNGSTAVRGVKGTISSANSLVGTATNDSFFPAVTPLTNGNYVVGNRFTLGNKGAATWGNGTTGTKGVLSASNSLVGTTAGDQVGSGVYALGNGNYVVSSGNFSVGGTSGVGAVTWGNGYKGTAGSVTTANSLVGAFAQDHIGYGNFQPLEAYTNSAYVFTSVNWSNNGTISHAGAVTLQRGNGPYAGTIDARNSVLGQLANSGNIVNFDYDATRDQLVVGRPVENIVTLFRPDELFKSSFEMQ